MKSVEKWMSAETISAIVIIFVLILSVVIVSLKNSVTPLMPTVLLGLLYLSMVRKWKALSADNRNKAIVSFAVHVLAMILVVAFMFI